MSSDLATERPAPFVAEHARIRWAERVESDDSLINAWERGQRVTRLAPEFGVEEVRVDRHTETLILRRQFAIVSVLVIPEISRKELDVVRAAVDLDRGDRA